jgi:hypothetical protein
LIFFAIGFTVKTVCFALALALGIGENPNLVWVWEKFKCKTFREYHDLYFEADVLLLADVFEAFRELCMQQYGVDPCHHITLSGMCIDCSRSMQTNIKIELIHTDPDKYTIFETGIRGGVSVVTHRYAKANNPLVDG